MNHLMPAEVGMLLADVATPALLIDLDAFEHNLALMADKIASHGVRLRPHAKTHKSPIITRRQMASGAIGACCQTVSEAEVLVNGGVDNVLVSNQVVSRRKIERLAALATQASIGVCVDHEDNVHELQRCAHEIGSTLNVLVEIDVGMGRCGVAPGQPALLLAQLISRLDALRFEGIQAYHGSAQHIRGHREREVAVQGAVRAARETVELLNDANIKCETVAGAGTGTFEFEAASGVYNELQAGSYVFMDADYARNLNADGSFYEQFQHSLLVLATVLSLPSTDRVVVDAGLKSHSVDSGLPRVFGADDVDYVSASDEHGVLDLGHSNRRYSLGEVIKLIPGHCDPTVNLHDWYVGIRNDRVECLWPVAARGPGI